MPAKSNSNATKHRARVPSRSHFPPPDLKILRPFDKCRLGPEGVVATDLASQVELVFTNMAALREAGANVSTVA